MKIKLFFSILTCCVLAQNLTGQLTEQKLQKAVDTQQCALISGALDTLTLENEDMKFNAAVCFYRNGDMDKSLTLFSQLHRAHGERWRGAAFWEAKIEATQHQDSLALATLHMLPRGFLNEKMLSQKEFEELARSNQDFIQLKQSVKPGFNTWTWTITVVAVIGFIMGWVFLLGRSKFSAGEKWLAMVAFSIAFILASYITIWTGYVIYFPYIRNIWPCLTLLIGPALYFYLKDTFKDEYPVRSVIYHFMLPVFSFLLLLPAIAGDFGIDLGLSDDLTRIGSSATILTGQIVVYTVLVHFLCQNDWQVDANIKNWTRFLATGLKLYTLAFLSYFILVTCSFFNPQWDYAISLVMSLGILVIAYTGFLQKRVFSSEPIETILSVRKYKSSTLTPAASEAIRKKLERILLDQQIFKENELRLDDLASYLDITRHQLSQVINEHYKVNFFELLNRYRVEYVKKILLDPQYSQYTIIQIAYEAGFNNKASFNKYFKQAVGLTPSAYRIRENEDYNLKRMK